MSERAVECECNAVVPVPESARAEVLCACARRVVVPANEEFDGNSVLISASTVERRVLRMLAAGQLPASDECVCCGSMNAGTVAVRLECEELKSWGVGGERLIIVPGLFYLYSNSEERVESIGRDNTVPVPVRMCSECVAGLSEPSRPRWRLLLGLSFVVMLALFIFRPSCSVLFGGFVPLVSVLAVISWWSARRAARWQRVWKNILSREPAYKQLLRDYPHATVILPHWLWAVKPE